MAPEMYCCCIKQPTWIFIYENGRISGICNDDFTSDDHRCFVKLIINLETRKKYLPSEIFKEILA